MAKTAVWLRRVLIAPLCVVLLLGQTSAVDEAARKVKEAQEALLASQEEYRKALLQRAAELRAEADALEKKAAGGPPVVEVTPPPAPVAMASPQPPAPAPTSTATPVPNPAPAPTSADSNEWEARAVLGFHQAGASSADSTQNYFFDFFIMRGLGPHKYIYDSKVNLWGNVRIASSPQQVDSSISNFVANFATNAGALKVNELAQSGEFLTGLGYNIKPWKQGTERIRMLEAVVFWGANGAFRDPGTNARVFRIPAANSPQRAVFERNFGRELQAAARPGVTAPVFAGFVPPDRERFYRQYGAGLRLTTFELNRPYAPPATYMFTLGRDQLITEGIYKGVVARADVFYPLPIGQDNGRFKFLFLFGTANLRLTKPANLEVMALEPAPAGTNLYDSNVLVISRPSARDTYRIGVGIDFVNLLNSWRGGSK